MLEIVITKIERLIMSDKLHNQCAFIKQLTLYSETKTRLGAMPSRGLLLGLKDETWACTYCFHYSTSYLAL